ncbi:MAG: hypothetical protein ACYCTV_00190 [Leptospirales bacterium]
MKKTLRVKLMSAGKQAKTLLETIETFNKACNWISEKAFEAKVSMPMTSATFSIPRHGRAPLLAVPAGDLWAVSNVSDRYKTDRKTRYFFKKHLAMEYDKRLLSLKSLSHASTATIHGSLTVSLIFGHYAQSESNN